MTDDNTKKQRKRIPEFIILIILCATLSIILILYLNKKPKDDSLKPYITEAVKPDAVTNKDSSSINTPEYETKTDVSLNEQAVKPEYETKTDVSLNEQITKTDNQLLQKAETDLLNSLPVSDAAEVSEINFSLSEVKTTLAPGNHNTETDQKLNGTPQAADSVTPTPPQKHNIEFEIFQLNGNFIEKTDKINPKDIKKITKLSEITHTIKDSFFVRENNNINGWLMVETKMVDNTKDKASPELNMRKYYYSGIKDEKEGVVLTNYKMENSSKSPVLFSSIPWKLTGTMEKGFTYTYKNTIGLSQELMFTIEGKSPVSRVFEKRINFNGNYRGKIKALIIDPATNVLINDSDFHFEDGKVSGWMIIDSPGYFKAKQYFSGFLQGETNFFCGQEIKGIITGTKVEYLYTIPSYEKYLNNAGLKEKPQNLFTAMEFNLINNPRLESVSRKTDDIKIICTKLETVLTPYSKAPKKIISGTLLKVS